MASEKPQIKWLKKDTFSLALRELDFQKFKKKNLCELESSEFVFKLQQVN